MRELAELEIDQDIAAQQAVVEHEVNKKMVAIQSKALLPCLEQKALAQFQQEMFELVDNGGCNGLMFTDTSIGGIIT